MGVGSLAVDNGVCRSNKTLSGRSGRKVLTQDMANYPPLAALVQNLKRNDKEFVRRSFIAKSLKAAASKRAPRVNLAQF